MEAPQNECFHESFKQPRDSRGDFARSWYQVHLSDRLERRNTGIHGICSRALFAVTCERKGGTRGIATRAILTLPLGTTTGC